jgi:phosphoenolpyruvate carboxykinase (diphosphate)
MNLEQLTGLGKSPIGFWDKKTILYINLKLALMGCPTVAANIDPEFEGLTDTLLLHQRETDRLLADYLCPADRRIQNFLNDYLGDVAAPVKLPSRSFMLDRYGLARSLSLPPDRDEHLSDFVQSYRVKQGVLHNPQSDRRTTQGLFHIAEGGLPIPDDKRAVPKVAFANLLRLAVSPPREMLRLPFTSSQPDQAECFVALLLRPLVSPEVVGFLANKSMEIRFFVPGSLVSNLDFVESIFGNAGDPFLPENNSALDVEHWTGHTGCVILAPHLVKATKKEVGLPHWDAATERQRRDSMCWRNAGELYNDGAAFKLTCRDARGVMVTIIADNYFGYCKKEVKTQISYSANLYGLCEEEHAGGCLVYTSYDLGEEFSGHLHVPRLDHSFAQMMALYGEVMDLKPEGYAIDKRFPDIIYVSEDVRFDLRKQTVSWTHEGQPQSIKLLHGKTYVRPAGYKVCLEKPPGGRSWRLVGTVAEPTFCHKPCTVSGGGKSEISKSIYDAIIQGPVFVAEFVREFDFVNKLVKRDYSNRFREKSARKKDSRPLLSPQRTLGSVIKLLTPSPEFTDEYNAGLESIPQYIKELVFVVKRFYKPDMGDAWRESFSVDIINGTPGNELKFQNRKLVTNYLRVGYELDGSWRTFGLRKDFHPAAKLSMEDDITASIVVPADCLAGLNTEYRNSSVKFTVNCEYRLFQRPDDAIHRGYDKQTELDFAKPGNFFSNYQPLTLEQARELVDDSIGFDKYTPPMQQLIRRFVDDGSPRYLVSSAHPRLVDGTPSKNPRYLQTRPDLVNPRDSYLAEMSTRLYRRVPLGQPIHTPVNAVLPGRRNNPPEAAARIRSLAVYNPIHYMELPELFMEFICSMTGKSPSTTGAGSEGALTKGPFNALPPIIDLNNALVSYLLTGYQAFITAAGYVGPYARVDHDVSLLVPEVWCRMSEEERDPKFLIRNGFLEKCVDIEHDEKTVLMSRLGYRITMKFVHSFFGRVFSHPHAVFTEKMLRPEMQDYDIFADGMDNVVETQRRVAEVYWNDGSIEDACPPLRAVLHIMRHDQYNGKGLDHPDIRGLFTRENLLASDWYADRLSAKQAAEGRLWHEHVRNLKEFLDKEHYADEAKRLGIAERLAQARRHLSWVESHDFLKFLNGTLGLNPIKTAK